MTMTTDRISQFEKMAREDPTNEMAHFSLGNAYLQSKRAAEAAKSFENAIAINPGMSKAYQLAGQAMIDAGWVDKAVAILNKGYQVAAGKGDRMPQTAMADLLRKVGREPPSVDAEAQAGKARTAGGFVCRRTGRAGTQLPDPPMRGPVGKWIFENISAQTWRDWIGQGTKVINELRLDFSRDEDQEIYEQHMREYLGIDPELYEELIGKKGK
ncbi:MAG: Fe(2+)-trafficking protein [Phycisphaerales bacterium]|nr:Fe(2+)-trafficking protein [Phycisphaerales bacterium]MCI0629135.1 Fe(2+)-trafficking protein [Phycisphaerales bacterium]MCI0675694.1 Fe(2+)-trafficking protein [Phycisphaerales bacterium]